MDALRASIHSFLQHLNRLSFALDEWLRARTPGPFLHLLPHAVHIWLVIDLHGVARRVAIAIAYLLTLTLYLSPQFLVRRQGILSQQIFAHPDALQLGQWHDRTKRLEQAEEKDVAIAGMEDALEELQFVILRLDHFWLKKRERHFVAGAIDNRIDLFARAIGKDDAIPIELPDIGLHFDAPVGDARQNIGTHGRMSVQRLMIGLRETILREVSHLEAQNDPDQLALNNRGKPLREDRRLVQRLTE